MGIHFPAREFKRRLDLTCRTMREEGLAGLLLFRQESMYWLTGYDTFGYAFFQCMAVTVDGRIILLTRSADRLQAKLTSLVEDVRIWQDGEEHDGVASLAPILTELRLCRERVGIEWASYGLNASLGAKLRALAFQNGSDIEDTSLLIARLRTIKSEDEIVYIRKAAAIADRILDRARAAIRPGAHEAVILAEMQDELFRSDGDYPANPFIIGSGPNALLCRYHSGRRVLEAKDQITLEFAGVYRHYHSCLMRSFCLGDGGRHQKMFAAAATALDAVKETLRPGHCFADAFEAHVEALDEAGFADARLNACGYSLGATYAPSWMDWPMIHRGNQVPIEPGMVIFAHMILMDEAGNRAMTLGETFLVTDGDALPLSDQPRDFLIDA